MSSQRWLFASLSMLLCVTSIGCGPLRQVPMTTNKAAGSVEQQFDTRQMDVDGDGDRARLSGYNQLNNPPVDLRASPPAHAGSTTLESGRYAGNAYGDTIAKLTMSIPGVTNAVTVVSGRVAFVGVTMRHMQHYDMTDVSREVRRRLLVQVPDMRYVYVTNQNAQVVELNRIADALRAGHPVSLYQPRLQKLMHELKPVPAY